MAMLNSNSHKRPPMHVSSRLLIPYLGCGNSSSSFSLTSTFILSNSCTSSFAAYGIVIRVTPLVLLHVWHHP